MGWHGLRADDWSSAGAFAVICSAQCVRVCGCVHVLCVCMCVIFSSAKLALVLFASSVVTTCSSLVAFVCRVREKERGRERVCV